MSDERTPAAFAALLAEYDAASAQRKLTLSPALDAQAGQKDSARSRLFWFSDLKAARAAARERGKPILLLRMLGELTDDLSCANSRFFRTILYSDPEINSKMREDFVLVWSSERPAPKITVDFGDGRVMTRTVTGNSFHAVLDASGGVLDVMPGLIAPHLFAKWLSEAPRNLEESRLKLPSVAIAASAQVTPEARPSARAAVPLAATKMMVQMPLVTGLLGGERSPFPPSPSPMPPTAPLAKLSQEAREALWAKGPMNWSSGKAVPLSQADFDRMITQLEQAITRDTAHNLVSLRPQIAAWLLEHPETTLESLCDWVYSNVFLTPKDDPWLGLVPDGVLSALEHDGIEAR